MIRIHRAAAASSSETAPSDAGSTGAVLWVDLVDPTDEEREQGKQLLGERLPTREETSAIELSSRFRSSPTLLRVNIPSFVRAEGDHGASTPLGFMLTPKVLVTVRYADSLAFDTVMKSFGTDARPTCSDDVFMQLIESIVDVGADRIEAVSNKLSKLSQAVFSESKAQRRILRGSLFELGALQRQITQIRAALVGVYRVVTFLCEVSPTWISKELHERFKTVHADIGSLNEFEQQLSERLQFLLDAVLGFINNDQNDIMRVLTVVSVATVPPMILAGIWGMNFKSIPEYDWPHGYVFAWCMILLSILVPLGIFKLKKWV
jgi:magnesium transporter